GLDLRRWLGQGVAFGGALGIGGLAAAIQLLPALELTRLGMHRDLAIETMQPYGSVHVLTLANVLAGEPFAWGAAALALAATATTAGRHRALAWWAVGWAVLSGLFALYRSLPFLGWFRFPDRIIGVTDFAVAVAAAVGLAAVDGDEGRSPRIAALVTLAVVAALAVAARAAGVGDRAAAVTAFAAL